MMRSLWAGVTGLQAHQIAMDVEGNNIANVNTTGFKYSRANFSDLLSQTAKIATAPQGDLGGKNSMQIGLGTQISSVTKIFKQGSIETTDKNTDLAIQGDGFFVVSPDAGRTYKYTRNGDFNFDAEGNFTESNGYIIQGWMKNDTGDIDTTAPIANITIPPGLTTPANKTSYVTLKANLDAGDRVEKKSAIYQLDSTAGLGNGVDGLLNTADDETAENFGVLYNADGDSYNIQDGQGIWASFRNSVVTSSAVTDTTGSSGTVTFSLTFEPDGGGSPVTINGNFAGLGTAALNANQMAQIITTYSNDTGIIATVNSSNQLVLTNDNSGKNKNIHISAASGTTGLSVTDDISAYKYTYSVSGSNTVPGVDKKFKTTEDLRLALQNQANATSSGAFVTINEEGKFTIANQNSSGTSFNINVTSITDTATENDRFTGSFASLGGILTAGSTSTKFSQSVYAATHASSIDVYDSLGTKHTVRLEFRKEDKSDAATTWNMKIIVPEPGTLAESTTFPGNMAEGIITFGTDGSLSGFNPPSITYSANNGSEAEQTISLKLGTINQFDGMTSFDSASNTSGISQDGYAGGDLSGIRVDETGTLIGSFTNGRSFGLAQVAMAKFTNNEGLESDGGNTFIQTSNSGDPVIGSASSGGRGFIQASSLEMSNVDLSRSLTQLIVIQRGYQANSKTITTSDQMLNTLLQLKQ